MTIMLDIQQKRKLRTLMYHRITLVVLALVVAVFLHSTWAVYSKKEESKLLMNSSKESLVKLKDRESQLSDKISRLDTEEGIEEEIRSKFSVAKDNEAMVVVVEGSEKATSSGKEKQSFWQKVKNLFR